MNYYGYGYKLSNPFANKGYKLSNPFAKKVYKLSNPFKTDKTDYLSKLDASDVRLITKNNLDAQISEATEHINTLQGEINDLKEQIKQFTNQYNLDYSDLKKKLSENTAPLNKLVSDKLKEISNLQNIISKNKNYIKKLQKNTKSTLKITGSNMPPPPPVEEEVLGGESISEFGKKRRKTVKQSNNNVKKDIKYLLSI